MRRDRNVLGPLAAELGSGLQALDVGQELLKVGLHLMLLLLLLLQDGGSDIW